MKVCAIQECGTPIGKHGAKGYCSKHYKRYKKNGDASTTTIAPRGSGVEERLRFAGWEVTDTGCWSFSGRINPDGYGTITVDREPYLAHRASYEQWVGPIPKGHVIRHTCDNRMCINPEHLLTGLPRDNTRDAQERHRLANGERHGMHKITDDEVNSIRVEYRTTAIDQRGLARKYKCSQAQISNILLGKQRRDETHLLPKVLSA
ncbi:HNH endonuclease signature motif containing protein [Paenarthrobacter sp. NPDC089322]|uniref:HNH endonuclease signature motif containing protein n=1 Tax=Paenarthrobacter sp. NPDC089322 TaxID=3155065 RepID=UPI00342BDFEF